MIKILIWKQCEEMLMLALQSYEQASGFSVLTADELYYVNRSTEAGKSFVKKINIIGNTYGQGTLCSRP